LTKQVPTLEALAPVSREQQAVLQARLVLRVRLVLQAQ
jgi:hypothetical protein